MGRKKKPNPKLCECGCGKPVTIYKYQPRRFIVGHYWRKKREIINCACGCGNTRLNYDKDGRPRRFINGHVTRGRHYKMSEEHKRAISLGNMGRETPPRAGELNGMWNKKHSSLTKQKISLALIKSWKQKKEDDDRCSNSSNTTSKRST